MPSRPDFTQLEALVDRLPQEPITITMPLRFVLVLMACVHHIMIKSPALANWTEAEVSQLLLSKMIYERDSEQVLSDAFEQLTQDMETNREAWQGVINDMLELANKLGEDLNGQA